MIVGDCINDDIRGGYYIREEYKEINKYKFKVKLIIKKRIY